MEIKRDGVTVLKGYIGSPEYTVMGVGATKMYAKYECYDERTGFETILVDGEYVGAIEDVTRQIISQYAPEYNIEVVEGTNINVSYAFTYQPLNAVLDQIAGSMAGSWFVHPNGTIYVFQNSISDLGVPTETIEYSNVETTDGYSHTVETANIRNKVVVLGGEGTSTYSESWVYNGTDDVYRLKYPAQNITVTWDSDPVYLVPEGYSGDPYKDSDKDLENTFGSVSFDAANPAQFTHVVVHHIAAQTATKADLEQWHKVERGWYDIGYHWYVKKDGRVIACCPESMVGAHAGKHNPYTIGIAAEGDYERFDTSMPSAQFEALTNKILDIMNRYNMPKTNIFYHGELSSTECPGKFFPKEELRRAVQKGSASNTSYTEQTSAAGASSAKRLYLNYSEQTVSTVPDYKPSVGAVINITYSSGYFVNEEIVDAASVAQYGRVIPEVIADTSITSKEDARAVARAVLNQNKNAREVVTFELVDFQLVYAGQKVYMPWMGRYGRIINIQAKLSSYDNIRLEVELI
jgi:N-acetyl-anhydromuramyl-L-alanine amidase AmpD